MMEGGGAESQDTPLSVDWVKLGFFGSGNFCDFGILFYLVSIANII